MNRYWIGDSGNWNDTAHWSASSGGAGGASVPTTAEDVFFDANSFSITGQTVTINDAVSTAFGKNINFTGILHSPTLNFNSVSGGVGLEVHGSLTFDPSLTITRTGAAHIRNFGINIKGDANLSIDTKNISIPIPVNIDNNLFSSITIDVVSDIHVPSFIQICTLGNHDFVFNTNNHKMTSNIFMGGGHSVTFNAGSSIIDLVGFTDTDGRILNGILFNDTGSIFNPGTSTIQLHYNPNAANFNFYDVGLNGQTVGEVVTMGVSSSGNPYVMGDQTFGSPNSGLSNLQLSPDDFITFVDGGIFNIPVLVGNGTSGHPITFRSDSSGSQYTIEASASPSLSYVDVKDCIASGSIPFIDNHGIDSGNNVNWSFGTPNVQALTTSYTTVQGVINVLDCSGQVTGIVYGPAPSPTISDSSVTTASIIGPFFVDIPTLIIPGNTTYLRPYTLCSGVYKYYDQVVVTTPAISPILLATDNLVGPYEIEILDGSNNIICNLTGYASNLSFVITRNRPEEITFSIPLLVLEQLAKDIFTDINTILNTGINAVRIKRKHQILLAGEMDYWNVSFSDPTKAMINIKAHGWLSLLSYRIFSQEYINKDQNFILQDAISKTQLLTHGNFGMTIGTSAVGTNTYADKIFENKTMSDIFIEFSEEADGIGFSFTWDKVLNLYWPDVGTQRQNILFTYPGNIESIDISSDSTKIVNNLLGRGQGNANSNINTIINDATSQVAYKLRSAVKDYPDIESANQLVNIVGSEVQFYKNPLVLHSLSYSGSEPSCPEVGTYFVNDAVRIAVSELKLLSANLNDFFVIDKQTVNISENGEEKVTLDFNNAPV